MNAVLYKIISARRDRRKELKKKKGGVKVGEGEVAGRGLMRLTARVKDVLLKETASEVSKQTEGPQVCSLLT